MRPNLHGITTAASSPRGSFPAGVAIPKNTPFTACVVPRNWTSAQIASRDCSNHTHAHLPRDIIADAVALNIIEWIAFPRTSKGERGLARWKRQVSFRGLSCRLGGLHAIALKEKQPWAEVMLAQIRKRRESASFPVATEELLPAA